MIKLFINKVANKIHSMMQCVAVSRLHYIYWGSAIVLATAFPAFSEDLLDCTGLNIMAKKMDETLDVHQRKLLAKDVFTLALSCKSEGPVLRNASYELGERLNPLVSIGFAIEDFRRTRLERAPGNFDSGAWTDSFFTQLNVGIPTQPRDYIYLIAAFHIQIQILESQPDPNRLAQQIKTVFIDPLRGSLANKTGTFISPDDAICFILNDFGGDATTILRKHKQPKSSGFNKQTPKHCL
jgi:hypothetical protein